MRCSDEEYEYRQEVRDKSVTARSARKMRTHNGKGGAVKFPSDYLTKKELKAMNGELKTFNINKPMTYVDFKTLPSDLKKDYIKTIRERFGAPDAYIAEMLGCSRRTLMLALTDLGCNAGKSHGKAKWARDEFEAWCRGEELKKTEEIPVETDIQPEPEVEVITETPVENAPVEPVVPAEPENAKMDDTEHRSDILIPESGVMNFTGNTGQILASISRILGNANISLSINWTVIKEE